MGSPTRTRAGFAWLPLALAGLLAAPAHATEVYRWVDENGVTHFTENPPPGVAADRVSRTDVPDIESSGIAAESAYDTEAHAERMAEWRAGLEAEREEARERERERAEREARQQPVVVQESARAVWWPPGYLRPPHHRPPHHGPDRPPFRPPHRPPRPEPPVEPPTSPPAVLKPR